MDVNTNLLLITAIFNAFLGGIILFHGPKKKTDITYFITVFGVMLWIISIIALRLTNSTQVALLSLAASYTSAILIAVGFWHFATFYTSDKSSLSYTVAMVLGGLIVSVAAFVSSDFIRSITMLDTGEKQLNLGPLHLVFMAYFITVMSWAFLKIFKKYRASSQKEERTQLFLVFLGTIISSIIGIIFNAILVQMGISKYINWGPTATFIMVGFITYAIMRGNLMNIKVIGAEFFALILIIIPVVKLVLLEGSIDIVLNGISVLFAAGFGIILIRSVIKEVKQKEQLKDLSEKLTAANEELKKLDAVKSEFISIASHQLRAPLAVIKGYASLLAERMAAAAEETRGMVSKIAICTEQLIKLVSDLLNLSRIEAGKIEYEFRQNNFMEMTEEVLNEFQPTAAKKGLRLIFQPAENLTFFFAYDSSKIKEVVINLIDNAIKYSLPTGEITITLKNTFYGNRKMMQLSVKDDGIGIPKEVQKNLFTKFIRLEEARKIDVNGMGLGLYFVKKVVEDHKGRVWVESEGLGKGSVFFIELPLDR